MPDPQPSENKDEFMERCTEQVLDERTADDHPQAVAVCETFWSEREMSNDIERRVINANMEVRSGESGQPDRMVGYAIRYNEASHDLGGFTEFVAPGAARAATNGNADVLAFWNHDSGQVLGRTSAGTLRLTEDQQGLRAEITPPAWAGNHMESIRRGDVTGMSFGFMVNSDTVEEREDGTLIRTLNDVEVKEVSPVSMPAYPTTEINMQDMRMRAMKSTNRAKGVPGEDTGGPARDAIRRLEDAGMTQVQISEALCAISDRVCRSSSVISGIANGDIENPPMELVEALESIDPSEFVDDEDDEGERKMTPAQKTRVKGKRKMLGDDSN